MSELRQLLRYAQPYWQRLVAAVVLMAMVGACHGLVALLVGPVFDPKGAYGMAVVETENEAEAEALAAADPVTLANLGFRYEVCNMPSLIVRDIDDL